MKKNFNITKTGIFLIRKFKYFIIFLIVFYAVYNVYYFVTKPKVPINIVIDTTGPEFNAQAAVFLRTVDIEAQSAYVFNIDRNEILFENNSDFLLPIASIAKLFVAPSIFDLVESEDETAVNKIEYNINSSNTLNVGERWNTLDLLNYSLIVSSNVGIDSVVNTISTKQQRSFKDIIEGFLKENYLNQTFLLNTTGLDVNSYREGGKSTARNIADLAVLVLEKYPNIAKTTSSKKATFVNKAGKEYLAKNTNSEIIDGYEILLSKTGFTDLAGGNLVVVANTDYGRIVIVVLNSKNKNTRQSDVKRLLDALVEFYKKNEINVNI